MILTDILLVGMLYVYLSPVASRLEMVLHTSRFPENKIKNFKIYQKV